MKTQLTAEQANNIANSNLKNVAKGIQEKENLRFLVENVLLAITERAERGFYSVDFSSQLSNNVVKALMQLGYDVHHVHGYKTEPHFYGFWNKSISYSFTVVSWRNNEQEKDFSKALDTMLNLRAAA